MRPISCAPTARPQRGLTLVELMIGMTLGLLIVGAALALWLGTQRASRTTQALTQMTEDAHLALHMLRTHLAMAGHQPPTAASTLQGWPADALPPLFACSGGASPATEGQALPAWRCQNPGGADALIVRYAVDEDNTVPTADHQPTDCLGQALPAEPAASASPRWVDNRFMVRGDALRCRGPHRTGAQPLVDNVVDLQLQFGLRAPDTPPSTPAIQASAAAPPPVRVTQYLRAQDIGPVEAEGWRRVIAVRICVLIRSPTPLLDQPTPYVDCRDRSRRPADRHLYRAYTSTVVLNNTLP